MKDLCKRVNGVLEARVIEVPGLVEDVEAVEDLITVSREASVRKDCIIGPLLELDAVEDTLRDLDKVCTSLLNTYEMLESLQQMVTRASQLIIEALDHEAEHIAGENGRAIQAIQSRINAKMANVKPEMEELMGDLWDRYSRRMAEIASRIEELKRHGKVGGERA